MLKSREILYEALTKDFLRASPDMAMLFGPFGCTHPPSPCPTVSVHTQPTYFPMTLPDMTLWSWKSHDTYMCHWLVKVKWIRLLRTVSNSIYAKRTETALPMPTKLFLQLSPDSAMLFAPFRYIHPPPPV